MMFEADHGGKALPRSLWAALLHPWVWRMAWRDSRSQRLRLVIFALAIVSGIAALVAEKTGYRGRELWSEIVQNAHRLLAPSVDVGAGLVIAPQ